MSGLESVALLSFHWPSERVTIRDRHDERPAGEGTVRHVRVSNFPAEQTREAMDAPETPILANEAKNNPLTAQRSLREFCIEEDALLAAYSTLAKGRVTSGDALAEIGDRYDKSRAQVALRWLVQESWVATIPKAASREHLEADLAIFDFELADEEMEWTVEV